MRSRSKRARRPGTGGPAPSYSDAMQLLHIAHRADWQDSLRDGTYTVSTRGRTLEEVGFIHASYPEQVAAVAQLVYRDDPEPLCVLILEESLIQQDGVRIALEDGGDGELYPHVYGPIRRSWVVDVRPARFDEDGRLVF